MPKKFIDTAGITHVFSKVKALVATKADAEHTHTAADVGAAPAPFYIMMSGNDTDGYTLDKTYAEISAALNADQNLRLIEMTRYSSYEYILSNLTASSLVFVYNNAYDGYVVTVNSDNTVTRQKCAFLIAGHEYSVTAHSDIRAEIRELQIDVNSAQSDATAALNKANSAVPSTRKVNGKALSSDISLTAADVGARPDTWTPDLADVGGSNPNLLDNWYFADPINQRGQTEYIGNGYTIDRWFPANEQTVIVANNGLKIAPGGRFNRFFQQNVENHASLVGKTVTFSALIVENNYNSTSYIGMCDVTSTIAYMENIPVGFTGLVSVTITVPSNLTQLRPTIRSNASLVENGTITFAAAKLELGSVQTLAHQDADGNWVLNDPPPDKGLELLKCIQSTADSSDGMANKVVLHTGNKPSGTYTGNGSASSRTIEVGGIGNILRIDSDSGFFIVRNGAIGVVGSSSTVEMVVLPYNEVFYMNGVLRIASTHKGLNQNNIGYSYQVL